MLGERKEKKKQGLFPQTLFLSSSFNTINSQTDNNLD